MSCTHQWPVFANKWSLKFSRIELCSLIRVTVLKLLIINLFTFINSVSYHIVHSPPRLCPQGWSCYPFSLFTSFPHHHHSVPSVLAFFCSAASAYCLGFGKKNKNWFNEMQAKVRIVKRSVDSASFITWLLSFFSAMLWSCRLLDLGISFHPSRCVQLADVTMCDAEKDSLYMSHAVPQI